MRPVDPALLAEGVVAPLELARELRMDGEPVRHLEERAVQRLQALLETAVSRLLAPRAARPALLPRGRARGLE